MALTTVKNNCLIRLWLSTLIKNKKRGILQSHQILWWFYAKLQQIYINNHQMIQGWPQATVPEFGHLE